MGAFLAALASTSGRSGNHTLVADWKFWLGVSMWAVGFAGNIYHDEILLDIRRNSKKDKKQQSEKSGEEKTHYAIPHGGLYGLISYPNYFSEWVEWIGYGIAATALTSQLPLTHVIFPFAPGHLSLGELIHNIIVNSLTARNIKKRCILPIAIHPTIDSPMAISVLRALSHVSSGMERA